MILISGGIGVTPVLSMLKAHAAKKGAPPGPAIWIHAAPDGENHAFRAEVEAVAKSLPVFRQHIFLTRPSAADRAEGYFEKEGRLTIDDIKRLVGTIEIVLGGKNVDIAGQICDFYVCGPKPMQDALIAGLIDWGVAEHSLHYESFAAPDKREVEAVELATITFASTGKTALWRRDDGLTLLEFAEKQGLEPACSCRMGACGACVTKIQQGAVGHLVEAHDIGEDQALICSAMPTSQALVLDL
jgi:ferredoxin-NADP reductase